MKDASKGIARMGRGVFFFLPMLAGCMVLSTVPTAHAWLLPEKKKEIRADMITWRDAPAASLILPRRKPARAAALAALEPASGGADIVLPEKKPAMAEEPPPVIDGSAAVILPVPKMRRTAPTTALFDSMLGFIATPPRLSEEDAARYAHIFAFQDNGEMEKADAEIAKLEDRQLLGHVLARRYLGDGYRSSYAELAGWMAQYADHPDARRIYDLALKKRPASGAAPLVLPRSGRMISAFHDFDVGQLGQPWLNEKRFTGRKRTLVRMVNVRVSSSRPTAALRLIETDEAKSLFSKTTYDALRAEIAQSYFYNGKPEEAFKLAAAAADRSGAELPLAGWIAGLSSFKAGEYNAAAGYFARAASSQRASAWLASAAAHWAARSYLRARQPDKVGYWLVRSAAWPRTFYGLISIKMLGLEQARFNWDAPRLTDKRVKTLSRTDAGRRALALADAGQPELAGAELRQMDTKNDPALEEAMVALALETGIPDVALRMGSSFHDVGGNPYDVALYPDGAWRPEGGFAVDRALAYAFIRQESRFVSDAKNRGSGARGLMQLMPATAKHVARKKGMRIDTSDLFDPTINVTLGQSYLESLLDEPVVNGNLFRLAVAYNAGPGKLARWERELDYAADPLLFIESIPVAETRMFVERVMTNFWIYRLKYGQKTESLDEVASGAWPVYVAQDTRRGKSFAAAWQVLTR
ncbi:MAG: lytic transglycosylase domain-containing protein [Alphaproteobacteria bacterium]|nr:lytic transglycosylase domain-containing protein [Alphaproteobacteria bacterium]